MYVTSSATNFLRPGLNPGPACEVGERGGGEDRASRHPDERVDGISRWGCDRAGVNPLPPAAPLSSLDDRAPRARRSRFAPAFNRQGA